MNHDPKTHVLVRKPGTGIVEPFPLHRNTWENMSATDKKEFELISETPPEAQALTAKKDMGSIRDTLKKINPSESQPKEQPPVDEALIADSVIGVEVPEEEEELAEVEEVQEPAKEKVKSKPGPKKKGK